MIETLDCSVVDEHGYDYNAARGLARRLGERRTLIAEPFAGYHCYLREARAKETTQHSARTGFDMSAIQQS